MDLQSDDGKNNNRMSVTAGVCVYVLCTYTYLFMYASFQYMCYFFRFPIRNYIFSRLLNTLPSIFMNLLLRFLLVKVQQANFLPEKDGGASTVMHKHLNLMNTFLMMVTELH